jgi:hypothetical protein
LSDLPRRDSDGDESKFAQHLRIGFVLHTYPHVNIDFSEAKHFSIDFSLRFLYPNDFQKNPRITDESIKIFIQKSQISEDAAFYGKISIFDYRELESL